jgi:hypothetical protein
LLAVMVVVTLALPAASAARTTLKHLRGQYADLACSTAKVCFTLSARGVTTLVDGSIKRSRELARFKSTRAISCAGDYCVIVGTATSKGRGVVVVLSHGKLGKARLLPLVPDVVSCPAAGNCIVAGGALGTAGELTTIAAAEIVNGKLVAKSKYVFRRAYSAPSVLALSFLAIVLRARRGRARRARRRLRQLPDRNRTASEDRDPPLRVRRRRRRAVRSGRHRLSRGHADVLRDGRAS